MYAFEAISEQDKNRVAQHDWTTALGDTVCKKCKQSYWVHEHVIGARWLTRLCNDSLVRLF